MNNIQFKNRWVKWRAILDQVYAGEAIMRGDIDIKGDWAEFLEVNHSRNWWPYWAQSRDKTHLHYDIRWEFYRIMLGESMVYTCGNFAPGDTLERAQANKHRRHIDWLELDGSQSLLECGFGWGSLSRDLLGLVSSYRGLTVSDNQRRYAELQTMEPNQHDYAPLAWSGSAFKRYASTWPRVDDRYRDDYRYMLRSWDAFRPTSYGCFDRFTSICMLEHVGAKNMPAFLAWIRANMCAGGIGTLQFISSYNSVSRWSDKYIFPGAELPEYDGFLALMKASGLRVTDTQQCGQDYVRTLQHWRMNIEANVDKVRALGFDEPFLRMMNLYLSGAIASFKRGTTDINQLRFEVV